MKLNIIDEDIFDFNLFGYLMFRQITLKLLTIGTACILLSAVANALSFGALKVKSALGQPLLAEVDIYGTASEIRNANIKMAHGSEYIKLGIEYKHFMRNVLGEYVRPNDKSKRAYFKFYSKIPFYNVNANFILEANWPEGRSLKSFQLILNPGENILGLANGLNSNQGARMDLPGQATIIREDIPYQDSPLDEGYFAYTPPPKTVRKTSRKRVVSSVPKIVSNDPEVMEKEQELSEINKRIKELKVLLGNKNAKK